MQVQTQFSIYLINKPGVLAAITSAIADAKINIIALALMDAGEHGALRIVCDDPDATRKLLSGMHDYWTETEVLTLELKNSPGAFAAIAKKLGEAHINISYAYCSSGAGGGRTTAVFKVSDMQKAQKIIGQTAPKRRKPASTAVRRRPGQKKS